MPSDELSEVLDLIDGDDCRIAGSNRPADL